MTDARKLIDHVVHLDQRLGMQVCARSDSFWATRDRAEMATGRLLSVFAYDHTWDYQERHPGGDELVYVSSGVVDVLADAGEGERAMRLSLGEACIVPAGSWHRIAVHEPATLLFITPEPAATEHRPYDAG
jgi:mannose-6-phosphate isomerase-like protein (cupin superfamily)